MHTPFASSGSVLLSIRCLLPARCFAEFHESLSLLVLFRWSLRFLDTRHVAFIYVCMYVIGLVSCFVEQHFYFRFRVSSFLSLSLLFVRNRIKERNRSTRGLIFFEFVRIHCSSSSLCLKKKQDEVYREGRESRLARPPSTSSGSLTLGLRLLAPGFRLVSERESPLFRFPSHPASTGSPVVQRKKGFRAK